MVPTIVALRNKIESIVEAEITRTLQAGKVSPAHRQLLDKMSHSLVNKILHDPTVFLKKDGMAADKSAYIDTVRKLFKL